MMTRKNYSSKKGGRKTNKRGMKKRGGFSWSSLNPFAKKDIIKNHEKLMS